MGRQSSRPLHHPSLGTSPQEICYHVRHMSSPWTPERRKKQSELAKQLVAEGKIGGAGRGQGRKPQKRASDLVAEKTAEEADAIFNRLMEIVRDGNDANSRAAAADLLRNEREVIERQLQEDKRLDDLRRDELLALVAGTFIELREAGVIPDDIIDGSFVEVEDGRPADYREIPRTT
jgi:hypothetical protein